MFPLLPSDNVFKLFLFGGLALAIVLITYDVNSNKNWEEEVNKYNLKRIEVKYQLQLDSLEKEVILKNIQSLRKDSAANLNSDLTNKELTAKRFLFTQKNILRKKNVEQLSLMYDEIKSLESNRHNDEIAGPVMLILAVILLFLGLIPWAIQETDRINYERGKFKKERKEIPCQSCGMTLSHDLKPHVELELCSHCFDGEKFIEDLTLKQMKDRVELQMKSQNINSKIIRKHLSKLGSLNRWNQSLRWNKHES